jgi:hypothetical protein
MAETALTYSPLAPAIGSASGRRARAAGSPTRRLSAGDMASVTRSRPPFECIPLVLQGGGALGAYQAGVYEALTEADLHPGWIAGISIDAINGALIAGNALEARVDKLRAFWEGITAEQWWSRSELTPSLLLKGDAARQWLNHLDAWLALAGGALIRVCVSMLLLMLAACSAEDTKKLIACTGLPIEGQKCGTSAAKP